MESILTPQEVRGLAREGRVAPDPTYHARQHHLGFDTVLTVLAWCSRVVPDERLDSEGRRRHPQGYIAWCPHWDGDVYRVDLNLATHGDGKPLLLVVTGMIVER